MWIRVRVGGHAWSRRSRKVVNADGMADSSGGSVSSLATAICDSSSRSRSA